MPGLRADTSTATWSSDALSKMAARMCKKDNDPSHTVKATDRSLLHFPGLKKYGGRIVKTFLVGASLLVIATLASGSAAQAAIADKPNTDNATDAADEDALPEITVTARRRAENLQKVPDSITVITSLTIENANIKNIGDVARITPGLNFRDGSAFAANFFDLRLRGIGQAQQGWPAVSLIVDGVPNDSPDILTANSLNDVERIEVLRGPQSALYGSGAIAGAINIVTKRPTNETEVQGRLYYGNGQDAQASAAVSGTIIPGKLLGRLSFDYRNDNGRFTSPTNGLKLSPHDNKMVEGRLIYTPVDSLEIDLRGSYVKNVGGFAITARTNVSPDFTTAPQYIARTSVGLQEREFQRLVGRINWDLGGFELTSITSYSRTRQYGNGSGCFDDVNNPNPDWTRPDGSIVCLFNFAAYGYNRATTGQIQEVFQGATDNYRTIFQDLRIASQGSGPIQWLFGGTYMRRRGENGVNVHTSVAGGAAFTPIYNRLDGKLDRWWSLYGQVGGRFGAFELTVNARYDDQDYYNSAFNQVTGQRVPIIVFSPTGVPLTTQHESKRAFQPKGQLSYHLDENIMAYVTVSRGFRAGFFSSGAFAAPEHTTNYEGGFKAVLADRMLIVNAAAFHIDYSNQQTSQTIAVPPFRTPIIIPKTRINGAEVEATLRLSSAVTLAGQLAYLDAKLVDGSMSPKAPKWSGSISGQLMQPLSDVWTLNARADLSFHSAEYLFLNNTQRIPSNAFLSARIGIERKEWGAYLVGTNLTNRKESQMQSSLGAFYRTIYPMEPRTYGIELRFRY
jgi:iron complex outermembrane receptor protein